MQTSKYYLLLEQDLPSKRKTRIALPNLKTGFEIICINGLQLSSLRKLESTTDNDCLTEAEFDLLDNIRNRTKLLRYTGNRTTMMNLGKYKLWKRKNRKSLKNFMRTMKQLKPDNTEMFNWKDVYRREVRK